MESDEKKILLQEIHHRVKNNFQIIISLVELQVIRNPENKSIFIDLVNRIRSISLIYENLLLADNLNFIKFCEYTKILTGNIQSTYNKDVNFLFSCNNEILLNIDQATSTGIAINELIINIYHHAFTPDKTDKQISISIEEKNKKIVISISDNGIGINEKFLKQDSSSLGLNLVKMLIKQQLNGQIFIKNDNGTKIIIEFDKE
jgi:two-component sensor histidine kinase